MSERVKRQRISTHPERSYIHRDVLGNIVCHLPFLDFVRVRRVSKEWCDAVDSVLRKSEFNSYERKAIISWLLELSNPKKEPVLIMGYPMARDADVLLLLALPTEKFPYASCSTCQIQCLYSRDFGLTFCPSLRCLLKRQVARAFGWCVCEMSEMVCRYKEAHLRNFLPALAWKRDFKKAH